MRLFGKAIVVLTLALPSSAFGQKTAAPADLVGAWLFDRPAKVTDTTSKMFVTFRDDGTGRVAWTKTASGGDSVVERSSFRWSVAGDTLWIADKPDTSTRGNANKFEVSRDTLRWAAIAAVDSWNKEHPEKPFDLDKGMRFIRSKTAAPE